MPSPSRSELINAKNVLARRRGSTADPAEQAAIDAALAELNDAIEEVDQVSLLQAAGIVARATDALERVVASARTRPFDGFLADMQQVIGALQSELGAMQGSERLAPALLPAAVAEGVDAAAAAVAAPATTTAAPAPAPTVAPPAAGNGDAPPVPIDSTRFDDLRDEYASFYDRCRLRPEFEPNVGFYVSRLLKFKPTYQLLGTELGIPWVFIGVVHGLEGGFDFGTHLHNGDPLSQRTVHHPAGRPPGGSPPFTWIESARDALRLEKLDQVHDWTLPRLLYQLEAYNGFGYRPRGVPTPYLWSFSTLYRRGKFVADGVFDPDAESRQCGAAVILRTLQEQGAV